jgi:O-antigen/teichoic acid export membrane protein
MRASLLAFALAALLVGGTLAGLGIGFPNRASVSVRYLRRSIVLSGHMTIIVLLQTAYGIGALLILGAIGRYDEAAELSPALAVAGMLPSILTPVYFTAFYPRFAAFVARNDERARTLASIFIEGTIAVSVSATALMMLFPNVLIEVLYSSRYASSSSLLAILAPLSIALALDGLLSLGLVVLNRPGSAIAALAVRSLIFVALLTGTLVWRGSGAAVPIALAYLTSALVGAGLQLWIIVGWAGSIGSLRRIVQFAVGVMAIAIAARVLLPDVSSPPALRLYPLALAGAGVGGLCLLFLRQLPLEVAGSGDRQQGGYA